MIKLELSESEYKSLLLNYHLGKLVEGDVIQEDRDAILASANLNDKLCKAGFDAESKIVSKNGELYNITDDFEEEIDEFYGSFIEFVSSGEFEKEMDVIRKQIEEMKKGTNK